MRIGMKRGVFAVALAACTLPPVDDEIATCGPSMIVRASTGETFSSFEEAVESAHTEDAFCVGAGTYRLQSATLQRPESGPYRQSLRITGAGSAETILVADEGYETLFYVELAGSLVVEGLTISGGRARLEADELTVRDLKFVDYAGWKRGLALSADLLEVEGLEISDNQMDYASGLFVDARELGTISGLSLHHNRSAAGYLAELHGVIELRGSHIYANVRSDEQPGYDLLEFFGPSVAEDVVFEDNDFNGPMLRAYDSLDSTNLVLRRNKTGFAAALALMGPSRLCASRIENNVAPDGALGIYHNGSVALDSVNADVDKGSNAPCDLAGKPCADQSCMSQCFEAELGEGEPSWCDAYGCEQD
jgi:hypothetical protein